MDYKNRIEKTFTDLKKENKKALIPFITGGYPDYRTFIELFFRLENLGSDIIEIGMPFSDPLADGPVIQHSSKISLEKGFNTHLLFKSIKEIREKTEIPIAVMTYFNIIYSFGIESFLFEAENSRIDGLIIPDLPLEEFLRYKSFFSGSKSSIANIMLATLSTDNTKIRQISGYCSGFLYCVLLKGVTGAKNEINSGTLNFLERVRDNSTLPLAVGFGMSDTSQVEKVKDYCDGVIIGSRIISLMEDNIKEETILKKNRVNFNKAFTGIENFMNDVRAAL